MSNDRLNSLLEAVDGMDNLLILPHNDPDPDAIASAAALGYLLAEKLNMETNLAYHGIIGRAENKALVNYLDQPFQALATVDAWDVPHVALVDTQPGLVIDLLKTKHSQPELEGMIAEKLDLPKDNFWGEMDRRIVETYQLELT